MVINLVEDVIDLFFNEGCWVVLLEVMNSVGMEFKGYFIIIVELSCGDEILVIFVDVLVG